MLGPERATGKTAGESNVITWADDYCRNRHLALGDTSGSTVGVVGVGFGDLFQLLCFYDSMTEIKSR